MSTRASPPALIAHQAIHVLCVIVPHGFRYRAIDSLESEGTVYDDLVPLPHDEQGQPQLDQAAQSLIQPHLGRDSASTASPGSLFHCTESQNDRMARVGRDLEDDESPTPLPHAGPPTSPRHSRPGCPGPHPRWPRTPPGMDGDPQPLWAAVAAPHHCHSEELPPAFQPQSSLPQFKTVSPCPLL